MTAATARAKTRAAFPQGPDYSRLQSVGLNRDTYEILRKVSFHPALTINAIQGQLPNMERVATHVQALTKRLLLERYRSVYNLTRYGWIIVTAADLMVYPYL